MPWIIIHSFPFFFQIVCEFDCCILSLLYTPPQNWFTWGVRLIDLFWSTSLTVGKKVRTLIIIPMWTMTTLLLRRSRSCQTESNECPSREFAWWNLAWIVYSAYMHIHSADDSLNLFSSFLFWIFDFTVVEEVYAYPFPTIQEYKRNMQVLHVICAWS